jgi:WG containing repeat
VVQPQYSAVSSFSEGLAAVRNQEHKWGYIDTRGQLVIPFMFQSASQFSDGLAQAELNQKFGYIDKSGNFVIRPQFAMAGAFSEGLQLYEGVAKPTS